MFDEYTDDNSDTEDANTVEGYLIENTEEEALIGRIALTLTEFSMRGSSYDIDTYSDDVNDVNERDSNTSSSSGRHH